jgi:hypothetical protein
MNATANGTFTGPDRAEISRRNGAKSRGPRTAEGKYRSKWNALKHGMTARTLVLPGEDPADFEHRIDTWTGDLQPRNETERFLVQRAAAISWQLDRVDRADAARLASRIQNEAAGGVHRQRAEAEALGRRLFHGPRTSFAEYKDLEIHSDLKPRALGASALAADPDHAATLVFELESTAAGCQWLLDRWAELRERWEHGQNWGWFERFRALRLLGKQALGVESDPVIDAILPNEFRVEDSMQADDIDDEWEASRLDELDEVLDEEEIGRGSHDGTAQRRPDSAASSQAVTGLMSAAIARLEALAREHRECETADLTGQASRLSFDPGDEAERLRRYQVACNRNLLRTLDALFKVRRHADESEPSESHAPHLDLPHDDRGPRHVPSAGSPDAGSQVRDDLLDPGLGDPCRDSTLPGDQRSESVHSTQNLRNEPSVTPSRVVVVANSPESDCVAATEVLPGAPASLEAIQPEVPASLPEGLDAEADRAGGVQQAPWSPAGSVGIPRPEDISLVCDS